MIRVVITGIGAVTPLGNSFPDSWSAIKAGLSGIRTVTKISASQTKWKAAGEVADFKACEYLGHKELRRLDAFVHYAVASAVMSAEDAGLIQPHTRPPDDDYLTSGGVIIGSSRGGITTLENAFMHMRDSVLNGHDCRLSPYLMPATTISMGASYIAQRLAINGYCLALSNACASGSNAIGEAYRLLKAGFRGPVIAGGTDAPLCRVCIEGYGKAGALSKHEPAFASRPFDRQRDGFVLSEGACTLVLENLDSASSRGANIYGEVIGYGNTVDAFHQTKPDLKGEMHALRSAMADAGISPADVDYINAHGTSTPIGDRVEAESILSVFGKKASQIPVSAVKSMTGHMLAASGAFEAACTAMSLREGLVPPTINVREKDSRCGINLLTEKINLPMTTALSSSFGFGGVNAVLIFRKLQ
ncbi:MAG: beta-ketoacyl-ACP synthase II [Nitrospirota bacterium]|nr:beta-ketoacyl-ACP synthase II [Nitrospirota bacterium]